MSPSRSGRRRFRFLFWPWGTGFSLVELLVGFALLSAVFLVGSRFFSKISVGVTRSRSGTTAAQLTERTLNRMLASPINRLLVGTTLTAIPGIDVALNADVVNYPPETSQVGSTSFVTYALVEKVIQNGAGQSLTVVASPGDAETNMRRITVTTVWTENGHTRRYTSAKVKQVGLDLETPAVLRGTVTDNLGTPLRGVQINVLQSHIGSSGGNYRNYDGKYTRSDGTYELQVYSGIYSVEARLPGKDSQIATDVRITTAISPVQLNFTLQPRSTGQMSGKIWYHLGPVISQVVGDTVTASGFHQEYVELFLAEAQVNNLWSNNYGYTLSLPSAIWRRWGLRFQRRTGQDASAKPIKLRWIDEPPVSGTYYFERPYVIFANTNPVVINGVSRQVHAVWDTTTTGVGSNFDYWGVAAGGHFTAADPNIFPVAEDGVGGTTPEAEGAGALELYDTTLGLVYDRVGWSRGPGLDPAFSEGTAIQGGGTGLRRGEQFVRYSSTAGIDRNYGSAYDSGNNDLDFGDVFPMTYRPFEWQDNTNLSGAYWQAGAAPRCLAGTVDPTLILTGGDEMSDVVRGTVTTVGGRPVVNYSLTMGTGTYPVFWSTALGRGYTTAFDNSYKQFYIARGTSVVTDLHAYNYQFINPGFFPGGSVTEGTYRNGLGMPVPNVAVAGQTRNAGGGVPTIALDNNAFYPMNAVKVTNAAGFYRTLSWGGLYISNNDSEAQYVNFASTPGGNTPLDLVRNATAFLRGRVVLSDGVSPAEGFLVKIYYCCSRSTVRNQTSVQYNGYFDTYVGTGTWEIVPTNNTNYTINEITSPESATVSVGFVDEGNTIFAGSFTVVNNACQVAGRVTNGGAPVASGVLVTAVPAAVNASFLTALSTTGATTNAGWVSALSDERGNYQIRAPTPGNYNLYAFFSDLVDGTVTVRQSTPTAVVLSSGSTLTSDINF